MTNDQRSLPRHTPTTTNPLRRHTLRSRAARVSYSAVTSPYGLPYPATRGDSRIGRIISRAGLAEAVVGRVSALVAVVVRSRSYPGDRTLLRLLASLLSLLFPSAQR